MRASQPRVTRRVVRFAGATVRVDPRAVVAGTGIIGAAVVTAALALLAAGGYPMTLSEALAALFGVGDDPLAQYFVQEQRAPRIVLALLVGAALGVSGAIFQSLSANPLGSPDVVGFTVGAATGALVQIILLDGGPAAIAIGALAGGFGAAAIVYALAWRGGLSGIRLVLVGIGIAAVLQAVNSLLIVRASLSAAMTAAQWLAGSFNASTWPQTLVVLIAVVVLVPLALVLARPLDAIGLGDDLAAGLGVRVERRRLELVIVGVALVSLAVAAAGPIAFVALAAPQIGRRLTGTAGAGIAGAALTGALLVLLSDVAAQRVLAPNELPVGVVTGTVGGVYLIWLLSRELRRGAA